MTTDFSSEGARRRGVLVFSLAAIFWGTAGISSKFLVAMEPVASPSIALYRLAFALPVLMIVGWRMLGADLFRVERRDLAAMLVLAVSAAGYQIFYFAAVARAGVAVATLVALCSAPALLALLGGLFLGERLNRRVVLALATTLCGTVLLVGVPTGLQVARADVIAGILLAGGSALSYAGFTACSRSLARRYRPVQLICLGFGGGALVLMPAALVAGLSIPETAPAWGVLLYLGLVPTALAYVLFFTGMRDVTATVAGILTLIEPLTATVLAWLVLEERLGPTGLVGAAVLVGGLLLLYRPRRQILPPG